MLKGLKLEPKCWLMLGIITALSITGGYYINKNAKAIADLEKKHGEIKEVPSDTKVKTA